MELHMHFQFKDFNTTNLTKHEQNKGKKVIITFFQVSKYPFSYLTNINMGCKLNNHALPWIFYDYDLTYHDKMS